MSKTRENRLWAWLAKAKPIFKRDLVLDRVENSLMKGMADVNGCLKGESFWVELKCAARPSNAKTKVDVKFQHGQADWHKRRSQCLDNTYLLVQVGSGHKASRYLFHGIFCEQVEAGITEEKMAELAILPGSCSPQEVVEAMVSEDF